ncbi:MAG: HAMP domain-containing histidine kinase [Oscillospiraceae bacterium]|nr:HAMP domain-containing histidine kinase [Oscillospiraceae bacterium]
MRKLLCSPVTKAALFFIGYLAAVSFLRAESHTLNVLFSRFFGDRLRFDGLLSGLLLALCVSLLFLSVWMTKRPAKKEPIFRLWRNLDFSVLVIFTCFLVPFFISAAHENWDDIFSFFPPLFAYGTVILLITELAARIRDKDLLRTSYWVRFFRAYPVWKPLGLLFVLLFLGNLIVFFVLIPEVATLLRFHLSLGLHPMYPFMTTRWFYDLSNFFLALSAINLAGLTYFAAVLLGLSARHAAANAEKVRAEQFKSELITGVSHDIRTPLTSIINYVDLLKSQPLEGDAAEYVAVLDKKSARLKTLIDDLMDASKAGTGNVNVTLTEVNLTELIGQVAGEFDEDFAERGLTLVLREPDEPVFAHADSRHLWRVLENLFSNAAKYTLTGTRVFAELTAREGKVGFTLKNTSQSPIDLSGDALTEQFIRGDRARQTEGNGLGLYIAKSLVELMGGRFEIGIVGDLFVIGVWFG